MTDSISVTGLVATVPERRTIRDDVEVVSFRLASSQRYFDRSAQAWVKGETNWYTVSAFRYLASNVRESVHKGDRVVVMGRLRVRRWENKDKKGLAVDIDAESIGQDLAWGTARYIRTPARDAVPTAGPAADDRSEEQPIDDVYRASDVSQPESDSSEQDVRTEQGRWDVAEPGSAGISNEEHSLLMDTDDEGERAVSYADSPS